MNQGLAGVKVGDIVTVVERRSYEADRVTEAVVVRIGREYTYLKSTVSVYALEQKFFTATGNEFVKIGYADRAFTAEGYADHILRESLFKELEEADVKIGALQRRKLATGQLLTLVNIITD